MSDDEVEKIPTTNTLRLLAVAKEFNIGKETLVEFLSDKGFEISSNPSTRLTEQMYKAVQAEFAQDKLAKLRSEEIALPKGSLFDSFRKSNEYFDRVINEENELIETDADTSYEDDTQDGWIYPFDPVDTAIVMEEKPYSVFEYLRQFSKGKINTQPDFQRKLVWNDEKKSKFIESIILNFPIPPIYLNENIESNYSVIDGLQRTTALDQFYQNKFKLFKLEALPSLIGKKFQDLAPTLQSKFEDKKFTAYILKPSTPMAVIYDLFNRINTGGTQLNRQEVRNCIFIGKSTKLLKTLSEEQYFKEAIDWGITDTRMKDRETILRYLSFRWFDFNNYNGNMSEYVETAMKEINKMTDEKIQEIKIDFKKVMELSFKIWGRENFRIPKQNTRGAINTAILETVCHYLSNESDAFIEDNLSRIKENYKTLIDNEVYFEAVTKSTGNKSKVFDRFKIVHYILPMTSPQIL